MNKGLLKFFDVAYFLRFAFWLAGLYYFHLFYIGLTAPGGIYSPFLAQYVNYIVWFRYSVLHAANLIAHVFGLPSYVSDLYTLQTESAGVVLVYSCLGLGVMSFWMAFVTAHRSGWRQKLCWSLAGAAAIWFINCWRVALLLMALQKNQDVNKYMDHHDLFNLAAYSLVVILMYAYHTQNKKAERPQKLSAETEALGLG